MLRYASVVAPLPAALHLATQARSFAELTRAAAAVGVAVQPLRRHTEPSEKICGCAPFAAPWTVEPMGPTVSGSPAAGSPAAGSGDGPLAGMVVVEAGRRVQGPLAGHLLELLGAHVISIEPAGGDTLRAVPPMAGDCSARFLALHRAAHRGGRRCGPSLPRSR